MKPILLSALLLAALSGCASGPPPDGVRATQAMTDMDGRPIDPGPGGLNGGFGIGFGFGSWGRGGGIGIGVGTGW